MIHPRCGAAATLAAVLVVGTVLGGCTATGAASPMDGTVTSAAIASDSRPVDPHETMDHGEMSGEVMSSAGVSTLSAAVSTTPATPTPPPTSQPVPVQPPWAHP